MGFTTITGDQAKSWAEVRKRLLRPDLKPDEYISPSDQVSPKAPFRDKGWVCVPSPSCFHYAAVGNGRDYGGWPRREGVPDIETYLDPLIWCLREQGCEQIIITTDWHVWYDQEPEPDSVLYCSCPLNVREIARACDYLHEQEPKPCGLDRVIVFDSSRTWASVDLWESDRILGGTPDFIARYFDAAGGEDSVRAWYYHWEMWHHTSWQKDGLPFPYNRAIYDLAGWPYPPYEMLGTFYANTDIDWTPLFGDRIKSCGPGPN